MPSPLLPLPNLPCRIHFYHHRSVMIQLLFAVVFAEMALILLFLFKTPLPKLMIKGLDRLKRGRGPVVVKAAGGTVLVMLLSGVYSMMKIRHRSAVEGALNPTDQLLMAAHLLESTLMGGSLFLAMMIDRLHHYIRELHLQRKSIEMVKKQNCSLEDDKANSIKEIKAKEEEVVALHTKLSELQGELETKRKEVSTAETNVAALRKQSEGFLLEYDRLLEENQDLRSQLQPSDLRMSYSGGKKNT